MAEIQPFFSTIYCCICLESVQSPFVLPCTHYLCSKCAKWLIDRPENNNNEAFATTSNAANEIEPLRLPTRVTRSSARINDDVIIISTEINTNTVANRDINDENRPIKCPVCRLEWIKRDIKPFDDYIRDDKRTVIRIVFFFLLLLL